MQVPYGAWLEKPYQQSQVLGFVTIILCRCAKLHLLGPCDC